MRWRGPGLFHITFYKLLFSWRQWLNWATQELSLNMGLGINVPFYNRLRESGYNKTYMRMYDHVKPFVKLQLKYTIR